MLLSRSLFLQLAPADEVLRACADAEGWPALACQQTLLEALVLDSAARKLSPKYRHRVLKRLLRALDGHEICEGLLEAYISADAGGGCGAGSSVLTFEVGAAAISLRVSDQIGGEAETSGCLWNACPPLAAWLLAHAEDLANATVIELGSGTGLAGLVAACLDMASVTLTDNAPSALCNLRAAADALGPAIARRVAVELLDWTDNEWVATSDAAPSGLPGEEATAPRATERRATERRATAFDLIIASDCTYNPDFNGALCATLGAILRASASTTGRRPGAPPPRAWLAAERRTDETWAVFEREMRDVGLVASDLSEDLRAVVSRQSTFHCSAEALPRVQLLEIHIGEVPPVGEMHDLVQMHDPVPR